MPKNKSNSKIQSNHQRALEILGSAQHMSINARKHNIIEASAVTILSCGLLLPVTAPYIGVQFFKIQREKKELKEFEDNTQPNFKI